MNGTIKKALYVATGAALLTPGVALATQPADNPVSIDNEGVAWTKVEAAHSAVSKATVQVSEVQGAFAYGQDTLTSTNDIAEVFGRAASVLCGSKIGLAEAVLAGDTITVSGNGTVYALAVDDAEAADEQTTIMGCACASNLPGGGAIANAEVTGVSIGSLASLVR